MPADAGANGEGAEDRRVQVVELDDEVGAPDELANAEEEADDGEAAANCRC